MSLRTWFRSAPAKASEPSPAGSVSASTSSTGLSAEKPITKTQQTKTRTVSKQEATKAREVADMHDAMALTALLLNDDMDGAETQLRARKAAAAAKKDVSAFHLMGLGLSTFMRAVLGFEKDMMAEANARLGDCETRAWEEMRRAQNGGGGGGGGWFASSTASTTPNSTDSIYPPGSEYALVHAETQVMLAVVAELHESLAEAIKGFYKLRKAFVALHAIIEAEDAFLNGQRRGGGGTGGASALEAMKRPSFSEDPMPGSFDEAEFADLEAEAKAEEEKAGGASMSVRTTRVDQAPSVNGSASVHGSASINGSINGSSTRGTRQHVLDNLTNPVDVFIHSGANMCFGMLLLMISMVPPAFSRLLSIVGFKGDRERGVRMLWQSTKFGNINSGMAGLVLLAYYNGLIAYSDILPSDADVAEFAAEGEIVGYPRERCTALLANMRSLYPDSQLWQLEEARLLATCRRAPDAMRMIKGFSEAKPAKMRQITALAKFELALDAMCCMQWELMCSSFAACVELNSWSHALYYYNMGCAEIELYRTAVATAKQLAAEHADADVDADADADADAAKKQATAEAAAKQHKKAAETYLRKAPSLAGKKKFMARQMPFDVFVVRKVARWEERAAALKIDLADAVGSSPALEMAFLWNGSKRLSDDLLEQALTYLDWSRLTAPAAAVAAMKAAPDEAGIRSLCRASLLRSLGRLDEARTVLQTDILTHDKAVFKGPTKDDYVPAAATYELAVVHWEEARLLRGGGVSGGGDSGGGGGSGGYKAKVDECAALLDKVAKWEAFVLDARIGMKLQTGLDTIRWVKKKRGWADGV